MRASVFFLRDPLGYLVALRERWGELVRTTAGPLVFHTFYDPRWVRAVLVDQAGLGSKRGVLDELEPVLGTGLLRSEGELWRRRRQALQPGFSRAAVDALAPTMQAEIDAWLRSWAPPTAGEVDATRGCLHLALAVVARTLFGRSLGSRTEQVSRAVEQVADLSFRRGKALIAPPLWMPTPRTRRYRASIQTLRATVRELVPSLAELPDVLRPLADDRGGDGLEAARDEAMNLFLAGHETTASTLAWALDHLARAPDWQDAVRAEAGCRDTPMADALVSEVLRLHPPAWMLVRRAEQACTVGGYRIPRRSFLVVPVFALHRHPDHWKEPSRFDPARFQRGEGVDPGIFLPFGAGSRRCIGEAFARLELRLALGAVTSRHRLEPIGPAPGHRVLTTLRSEPAVRLRLLAR